MYVARKRPKKVEDSEGIIIIYNILYVIYYSGIKNIIWLYELFLVFNDKHHHYYHYFAFSS